MLLAWSLQCLQIWVKAGDQLMCHNMLSSTVFGSIRLIVIELDCCRLCDVNCDMQFAAEQTLQQADLLPSQCKSY